MWLTLIVDKITLPARTLPSRTDENGNQVLAERRLELRSLDSYKTALSEFTPQRLRKLENTIGDVLEQIERLRRTPLVSEFRLQGKFRPGDLLRRPILVPISALFEGTVNLRDLAMEILGDPRRQKRPDYDESLGGLYKTIHRNTQHWHDRLVAYLLNDALGPAKVITEDSLRKWRQDHKALFRP
jgi:hypothetical protein